jgi:transposase
MASQPTCVVAMEACGGAQHWAREMKRQGHEPRLIAPGHVRPFVKRQKNDLTYAEAIVEAALRPTMRFVEAKDEAAQARCMLFPVRDQLVRQLSQTVNSLRAFLAEFGQIAPVGMQNVSRPAAIISDTAMPLSALARELCEEMLERVDAFSGRLVHLMRRINEVAPQTPDVARLRTMPGVTVSENRMGPARYTEDQTLPTPPATMCWPPWTSPVSTGCRSRARIRSKG